MALAPKRWGYTDNDALSKIRACNLAAGKALEEALQAASPATQMSMISKAATNLLKQAHEIARMEDIRNEEGEMFREFWKIWRTLPQQKIAELLGIARAMAKEKPADATGGPE
jgi:hypothetical protein